LPGDNNGESNLDPMNIGQFITGVGRIMHYKMDNSEGDGNVESLIEIYEG